MPAAPSGTAGCAYGFAVSKATDWLLDLLFPTRCVLCREAIPPGRPRICPRCQKTMPQPGPGQRVRGDFFSECVSALYYEGPVRDALRRYKFHGAQGYANAFGELVAARIYEELDGKYDVLSWVPISRDRRRSRGYDQAELIARNAAARLCREPVPTLKKRRGVKPQSLTSSPERRRANIAGAYTPLDPAFIDGKRILLIDDIVTTGSTLSECAKTLLLAGAEDVLCATLARTR